MNYITANTVISGQQVLKNSAVVFEKKNAGVSEFLLAFYQHLGVKYPKFYKMDNLSKLGWLAAEILLKDNFDAIKYKPEEIGIVFQNASSSLDADLRYFESTKDIPSPALFVYTLPNIVIGEISIKHKFKGENGFFIFEKFDADFLANYVSDLFNSNILQACICGWVELMGEEYKAVLFLVEKESATITDSSAGIILSMENFNKIYQLQNG